MDVQYTGINETLFYLKNYEKELYQQLRTDLIETAKPLAAAVGAVFPAAPLSNWHTSGGRVGRRRLPPYNVSNARSRVKPVAGGGTRRTSTGGVHILRISQMDAGGQVYDAAGNGNYESPGSSFISNLDSKSSTKSKRGSTRSRVMFTSVRTNLPLAEDAVRKVADKVDALTTDRIKKATTR